VEYDGPPLEALDLYTRKSGEEIVEQLYAFDDKGGRAVALRPEMTPTFARMVAARANALRKPLRWFSIPQLFRYERAQKGRLREHFQLNVDIVGETSEVADAELIALAADVMRELGLTPADVRVRVSDRRLLVAGLLALGLTDTLRGAAIAAVDKLSRQSREATMDTLARGSLGERESAQVIAMVSATDVDTFVKIAGGGESVRDAANPLRQAFHHLEALGALEWVDFDPSIVRGLAYYTGTVFELFDASRSLRAICGGGRYDNLLQALGGVDLPALGFGMGDVVLAELLRDKDLVPAEVSSVDVFLVFITQEDLPHVMALAHQLRDQGLRVEYALSPQAVGKQLKLADSRNARLAAIVGPDERARGEIVIKDLRCGSQETISLQSSADIIKARIHG
jgi:histidyl-tRNA synthetase